MIVYDLACSCGYIFEGWFQDRVEFVSQQEAGLLSCPNCGGNAIRKILSPVSRGSTHKSSSMTTTAAKESGVSPEDLMHALRTVQKFVEKNFEDVGTRLAEESLKIHYGVEEARNIRGVVTEEEEKVLEREGIELLKVPVVSEDDKLN
jgi:hypothetical protein